MQPSTGGMQEEEEREVVVVVVVREEGPGGQAGRGRQVQAVQLEGCSL
jgi:hypothetical protein